VREKRAAQRNVAATVLAVLFHVPILEPIELDQERLTAGKESHAGMIWRQAIGSKRAVKCRSAGGSSTIRRPRSSPARSATYSHTSIT
jgi:hypothetical protein